MSRLVVAALVLLLSIGGLLAAAAWNRGASQRIVLTERELTLPAWWAYRSEAGGDDRVLRLRVDWQPRSDPQEARLWLPDVKLREMGFTTGVPAGAPEAASFYGRSLPRVAWVAFEYDGPAWRRLVQELSMTPRAPSLDRESRLVPIDAGLDPERLRQRHAEGPVVVLPAIIRMRFESHPTRGPSVWAVVDRLALPDVSVPVNLRERLNAFRHGSPAPFSAEPVTPPAPRYEVVLRVGRFGAAWVEEIRNLEK
jgi:hypothetical protein